MRASLQQQIAPPKVQNTEVMSDAKVKRQTKAKDSTGPRDEVDFRSVLFNSNMDTKKAREAKKNGDLSAETQEEFLEKLADQTREKRVPKNKLGKDDFLKLFVTQLKNQDPLNPDDGAEMAAKLAQFNSLEQLMNVNKGIEKLAAEQSTNRGMMLSSFIGKDIQVNGGRVKLDQDKLTEAEFELKSGAKNATLQIRDTNGILVAEKDLGSIPPGKHKVDWDGLNKKGEKSANGVYTYSVMALDAEGRDIPVNISSRVKITGVDITDQSGGLFTDFGRVPLDTVQAVGEKGFFRYDRAQFKESINQPGVPIPAKPGQSPSTQRAENNDAGTNPQKDDNAKSAETKTAASEQKGGSEQQPDNQQVPNVEAETTKAKVAGRSSRPVKEVDTSLKEAQS